MPRPSGAEPWAPPARRCAPRPYPSEGSGAEPQPRGLPLSSAAANTLCEDSARLRALPAHLPLPSGSLGRRGGGGNRQEPGPRYPLHLKLFYGSRNKICCRDCTDWEGGSPFLRVVWGAGTRAGHSRAEPGLGTAWGEGTHRDAGGGARGVTSWLVPRVGAALSTACSGVWAKPPSSPTTPATGTNLCAGQLEPPHPSWGQAAAPRAPACECGQRHRQSWSPWCQGSALPGGRGGLAGSPHCDQSLTDMPGAA